MGNIILQNGEKLCTNNKQNSFKIIQGELNAFFVIIDTEGKVVRQMFIGSANAGNIIPSIASVILDGNESINVALMVAANNETVLEPCEINVESELFLQSIAYEAPIGAIPVKNDQLLEKLLSDYKFVKDVESETFKKNIADHKKASNKDTETILSAFDIHLKEDYTASETLYKCIEYMADKSDIEIAGFEEIVDSFGDSFGVQEVAKCSDIPWRKVNLEKGFYKRELARTVCFTKDTHEPVAIYMDKWNRKRYFCAASGKHGRLTKKFADTLETEAYCIYRPLNDANLDMKIMTRYAINELSYADYLVGILTMALITSVNLMISLMAQLLYDTLIPHGDSSDLFGYGVMIISYTIASLFFTLAGSIANFRIESRIKYALQTAVYFRTFHMPEHFYRTHESGEISYRAETTVSSYCSVFTCINQMILMSIFSISYFLGMRNISVTLSRISVGFTLLGVALSVLINLLFIEYQRKRTTITAKLKGFLFQTFAGIETVRSVGAEETFVSRFMNLTTKANEYGYRQEKSYRLSSLKDTLIRMTILLIMYNILGKGKISISTGYFISFTTLFGSFSASMGVVSSSIATLYIMLPIIKQATEILRTPPELFGSGNNVPDLKGDIKVMNLSFAYDREPVLNNISFHISPGEYVGIVGATGCGKTTLLKLLLGFIKPTFGKIFYDDLSLGDISKPQLRKKIRVVLQDDGLFAGSIYKNITLSNPDVTIEEVANALEKVGLTEEVGQMPMNIMTPVSDESTTISGGQKQRILLARAIVSNPNILFLDEATSSLDNIVQEKVIESIEELKATKLVIAHRLSTVKNCDKIIVMDRGSIVETGTYDELVAMNGHFTKLLKHQLDNNTY